MTTLQGVFALIVYRHHHLRLDVVPAQHGPGFDVVLRLDGGYADRADAVEAQDKYLLLAEKLS